MELNCERICDLKVYSIIIDKASIFDDNPIYW